MEMGSFSGSNSSRFFFDRAAAQWRPLAGNVVKSIIESGWTRGPCGLTRQILGAAVVAYELAALIATVLAADKLWGMTPLIFLRNAVIGGIVVHTCIWIALRQRRRPSLI